MRADFLYVFVRYFGDEARRLSIVVHAMQSSLLGVRDVECLFGARNTDVTEAAFLLKAIRVRKRSLMWEQTVLHAAHEHERKLEAFCRVHGHELYTVLPCIGLPFTRLQSRV